MYNLGKGIFWSNWLLYSWPNKGSCNYIHPEIVFKYFLKGNNDIVRRHLFVWLYFKITIGRSTLKQFDISPLIFSSLSFEPWIFSIVCYERALLQYLKESNFFGFFVGANKITQQENISSMCHRVRTWMHLQEALELNLWNFTDIRNLTQRVNDIFFKYL